MDMVGDHMFACCLLTSRVKHKAMIVCLLLRSETLCLGYFTSAWKLKFRSFYILNLLQKFEITYSFPVYDTCCEYRFPLRCSVDNFKIFRVCSDTINVRLLNDLG